MFTRKLLSTLLVAASTLTPVVALADTTAPAATPAAIAAACPLQTHHITGVSPYRVEDRIGRASVFGLRGATVYVQAEPGLTKEWLQLTLARHMTETRGASMPRCPLDLKDVTISVDSAGTGFAVRIVARSADKAEEVLRRAQLLLG